MVSKGVLIALTPQKFRSSKRNFIFWLLATTTLSFFRRIFIIFILILFKNFLKFPPENQLILFNIVIDNMQLAFYAAVFLHIVGLNSHLFNIFYNWAQIWELFCLFSFKLEIFFLFNLWRRRLVCSIKIVTDLDLIFVISRGCWLDHLSWLLNRLFFDWLHVLILNWNFQSFIYFLRHFIREKSMIIKIHMIALIDFILVLYFAFFSIYINFWKFVWLNLLLALIWALDLLRFCSKCVVLLNYLLHQLARI